MRPQILPDTQSPRGLSSAPVAEVFPVGDLLPGLEDIPYTRGNFVVGGGSQEKQALVPACCTFWCPNLEERALLGAGAMLQILTFAPKPAVQSVGVTMLGESLPAEPVVEGIALYLYETVHRLPWTGASNETRKNWMVLADKVTRIVQNWDRELKVPK